MKLHSTTYLRVFAAIMFLLAMTMLSPYSFAQNTNTGENVLSRIFSSRTPADEKLGGEQQKEQTGQKRISRDEARKQRDLHQVTERKRLRRNRSKEDLSAYVPQALPMSVKIPSYIERCGSSFEYLIMDEVEAMSLEDERNLDFTPLPDGYDELDSTLDPFKVSLADTKDTFKIDVHAFCIPTRGRVTSEFGFRRWRHHNGIDLKVQRGDTVCCAFDGVVRIRRYDRRGYGYFVVVRHTNGLETVYGHFSKFLVQLGDEVKAGTPLGLGGSTGRSTGPHLHLEFRYLGNPINPRDIVDFDSTYAIKNSTLVLTASNFKYKKELSKIKYWTVRKGDTLGRISRRTGVSISRICKLNGISSKTILRVGRRLRYN